MLPSLAAALISGSPDAVLVVDANGRYLDANPAACRLLGYTRDELLRLSAQDLLPPIAGYFAEAWATYHAKGSWRGEIKVLRKDGSHVPVEAWSVMIPGPSERIYASFLRDISARSTAEEDLATTHQHTREVLDRITDNFYALDGQGRFTYLNDAIERNFGYPREKLLGHTIWESFPTIRNTPLYDALHEALADGQTRSVEFYSSSAGRWYESRIYPSPQGLSVFFRDVTEMHVQQLVLQEALEAAQAGLRAKTHFLATMSDELRTPLQTVVGYAELLLGDTVDQLTLRQAEDVGAIRRAAVRMAVLVDELLTLTQKTGDGTESTLEPDELRRVVEQVCQELAAQAATKYVALRVDLSPHLPRVRGDLMRLHRILRNLVENAIKFTEAGEVTISAAVTDAEVQLRVRDTGIGIPADVLPHIFEDFYQADSVMTGRHEGAGLGLAIAKRFAEQIGGRLTVTSQPREGSAFTIHLALATPASLL